MSREEAGSDRTVILNRERWGSFHWLLSPLIGVTFDRRDGHVRILSEKITVTVQCMCIHDHWRSELLLWLLFKIWILFLNLECSFLLHEQSDNSKNTKVNENNQILLHFWQNYDKCDAIAMSNLTYTLYLVNPFHVRVECNNRLTFSIFSKKKKLIAKIF